MGNEEESRKASEKSHQKKGESQPYETEALEAEETVSKGLGMQWGRETFGEIQEVW